MSGKPNADRAERQPPEPRHTLLIPSHLSLPAALGLPPETRLLDTPIRSPLTIRAVRRYVEVRS